MQKAIFFISLLIVGLSSFAQNIIKSDRFLGGNPSGLIEQGSTIEMEFLIYGPTTGPFNLQVELSDKNGNFNNSTIIGSATTNNTSGVINGYICNVPLGYNYYARVVAATGGFTYEPLNGTSYTRFYIDSALHELTVFPAGLQCLPPDSVVYSPTFAVFQTNTAYQWYKNGQLVSTSSSYTDHSPADVDSVYLVATTPACVCTSKVNTLAIADTTAPFQVDITSTITPGVPICPGYKDTIRLVNIVAGATQNPDYNNISYALILKRSNGSGVAYSNGYLPFPYLTCIFNRDEKAHIGFFSNDNCGLPQTGNRYLGSSDTIIPTFHPPVEVTISTTWPDTICPGATVDFTSNVTNGASNSYYQWYVNGVYKANTVNYSTSALQTGDKVWLKVTRSANCSNDWDTSNHVSFVVQSTLNSNAVATPSSCANDGSVSVSVSNGIAPFSYLWNTGDTTPTVNNLPAGNYMAIVADASGCTDTATVDITGNSLYLDSISIAGATCAGSGSGSISLYPNGTNPPFSYTWGNGETTSTVNNLLAGQYMVSINDNNSCLLVQTITVGNTGLQVQIDKTTNADCSTGSGGALAAVALNGSQPYNYNWSNGNTVDTATNLSLGGHTVTITDAHGCLATAHYVLEEDTNCFALLSGRVYIDMDSSCGNNGTDIGIAHQTVKIVPGHIAYTNAQGYWQAYVDTGLQYQVFLPQIDTDLFIGSCNVDTLIANTSGNHAVTNLDWPKNVNHTLDAALNINTWLNRPGGGNLISVEVCNNSTNSQPISGSVVLDSAYTAVQLMSHYGITIDSISSSAPITVYFSSASLGAFQCSTIVINALLPSIPTVYIGQLLHSRANVSLSNAVDADTTNNNAVAIASIIAAYDPNDKQVFSNDESVDGLALPTDTLLNYVVRFQNTGNDTAFNIVIRDTLDHLLDPTTFRLTTSTHPVHVQFYEDRIIHFIFNNILLPDINVNQPASHGLIAYEIEVANPGLLQPISNQAAIYFDTNPPIYTNTVRTVPAEVPIVVGNNEMCAGDSITLVSVTLPQFSYYWTNNGNAIPNSNGSTITVTDNGNYSIALVYQDDTLRAAPLQVTVHPLPAVSLAASQNTVCDNATPVSLTALPAGGYFVGNGLLDTTFNPASVGAGTHPLAYTYIDAHNCIATAYDTIMVNANPTVTFSLPDDPFCQDNQMVDIGSFISPPGGLISGGGVNGTLMDVSTTGTFDLTYTYTNANGCYGTAQEKAIVEKCTGIKEKDLPIATVLPNPSSGMITIFVEGNPIDQVVILELSGKQLSVPLEQSKGTTTIDMSHLPNGVYIVKVLSQNHWHIEKIVLQR